MAVGPLQIFMAFALLVIVGLLMRVAGFYALYAVIRRWPVRRGAPTGERREQVLREARTAIRRACPYYFRQARCLQKSAVLVCLLRLRGLPAELVIGVAKMPFRAHAWVEVEGIVVNGSQAVKTRGDVIERC